MTVQFLNFRNFMAVRLEGERTVAVPSERLHLVEHLLVRVFVRRHGVLVVHARTHAEGVGACVPLTFRPRVMSGACSAQ